LLYCGQHPQCEINQRFIEALGSNHRMKPRGFSVVCPTEFNTAIRRDRNRLIALMFSNL